MRIHDNDAAKPAIELNHSNLNRGVTYNRSTSRNRGGARGGQLIQSSRVAGGGAAVGVGQSLRSKINTK